MFSVVVSEVMNPALTRSVKDLNRPHPEGKSHLPLRELEVNIRLNRGK